MQNYFLQNWMIRVDNNRSQQYNLVKIYRHMSKIPDKLKNNFIARQPQSLTMKSNIFQPRDNHFEYLIDTKQTNIKNLNYLSGSNFSLPENIKQDYSKYKVDQIKPTFASGLLKINQKGGAGSLFQMARIVSQVVQVDEYIKAEKEKNKYSFLQVPRSSISKSYQTAQNQMKASLCPTLIQRRPLKTPSFLKKQNKSSVDPQENQLESNLKTSETKNQGQTKKAYIGAKSQAQQKVAKNDGLKESQNYSPLMIKSKLGSASPINSTDSKNISTNQPKQSSNNNTLIQTKFMNRKGQRKGSMIINSKEFYTPTQKNSSKLGSSHFIQIYEKYNTTKNQNKSQLLNFNQEKNISGLSPQLDEKKASIPSFIKFKQKRNQLLNKSTIDFKSYINNTQKIQNRVTLDNFQIKELLGKGAFGDVYLARQKNLGFFCVLKKLSKKRIKQQNTQELIMRQIKIQSFLVHRHITSIYGFFDDQDHIYLIMEYMIDGSLTQKLGRKKVSQKQVARIIKQICEALRFMHIQNVIHRDIKPQNVFIHEDYIKIGDFGCSVFSDSKRNTMVGSLAYFSPEQLNHESYDEKIDVWSVGILCYQMLTGKSPFQQEIIKMRRHQKNGKLPDLRFPSKIQLSEDAKDFTNKLLAQIAEDRMTVCEALKHPFIIKNNADNLISSGDINLKSS